MPGDLVEWDMSQQVGELHLKGQTVSQIATQLGMTNQQVHDAFNNWQQQLRTVAEGNHNVYYSIMAVLAEVENHYRMVHKEFWELVAQADAAGDLSVKNMALKNIAVLQKDRANLIQELIGGDLSSSLSRQIRDGEREREAVIEMLRDVVGDCNRCGPIVTGRIEAMRSEDSG